MIDPLTLLGRLGIETTQRGQKHHAPCPSPDHDDSHPSWAAWEDKLGRFRHRCLSCGFGGGPANLIMAVLGLDRRQAHDFLNSTEQAGPPPPLHVRVEVRDVAARRAVQVPEEVWLEPFTQWPAAPRRYLELRGLGQLAVERWGLGYAMDGRLAGRVWFPVRNLMGDLVSWTARAFAGGEPKYDSSTIAAPHALLGQHLWPSAVPAVRRTVVVVEGPFDAVAVDLATGSPVAALRGSASGGATLDPGQAAKLACFDEVVIATDPDKAGERAAALIEGLGRHTRVRQARLEKGVDVAKLYENEGASAVALVLGLPTFMEDRSSMTREWG